MNAKLSIRDFSRMEKRRKAMELDVMIHWDFAHNDGSDPATLDMAKKMVDSFPTLRKNGTGLFAGTVASFPLGTKMHVVMEDGDLLYVDVPRGDMAYLMDPEGTFGYVKKDDVFMASLNCILDWME